MARSEAVQRYLDALECFEREREGMGPEDESAVMDELNLTPLWYALTEDEMAEVDREVNRPADKPDVAREKDARRYG
jgi:hypothetical protein